MAACSSNALGSEHLSCIKRACTYQLVHQLQPTVEVVEDWRMCIVKQRLMGVQTCTCHTACTYLAPAAS
jgi:hypothetical protein